jgi:hypothetical protein
MKKINVQLYLCIMAIIVSCNSGGSAKSEKSIENELHKIDSLLRSIEFSYAMAKTLDSSYQVGVTQQPAEFLTSSDDTAIIRKTMLEEKVAINLAGFYALECGIGLLSNQTQKKPTEILTAIVNNQLDSASVQLLNRFANATWKAGQPFRSLERITRSSFRVFDFLPADEVKKDYDQVKSAATKLLLSMQDNSDSGIKEQMERMRSLLQNEKYAFEMAEFLDSSYAANVHQPIIPFISSGEDTTIIMKSAKEQKVATSIAGFFALECGVAYLAEKNKQLPSVILRSIADNTNSADDKMLFARLANATWKAGQPFRGLNRITRATFTPFYFLNEADIEKDLIQVRSAAKRLLSALENE